MKTTPCTITPPATKRKDGSPSTNPTGNIQHSSAFATLRPDKTFNAQLRRTGGALGVEGSELKVECFGHGRNHPRIEPRNQRQSGAIPSPTRGNNFSLPMNQKMVERTPHPGPLHEPKMVGEKKEVRPHPDTLLRG
jgi:hypothetical protein